MVDATRITPRQIWADPTSTTAITYTSGCTPFVLPSNGIIHVNQSYALSLTGNAIYEPICTGDPESFNHVSPVLDTRDPFYSSVAPQLFTIGCATVISYVLVIILLITPRTFYVGGPGGGANFLGRHGMMSGSYGGNSSVIGVGGRPWLQVVAACLVAIALTIATFDSFKVAESQFLFGYSDAETLSQQVIDGLEIRIVRVISSTFLWLAQVQTLIRLFPRHKEKVMIKWAGFALIVLDTTFSILENFFYRNTSTRPRSYNDAIPALSYLFELALNLLYAAWVIFYSISKHRYAFFHPKMRNICFVALLSLVAVLIPVVFFVMDIARPEIAGWGTYIRWVGSAAASVVVWEWVERIEALERDENKDGILGREVFDGDEMLDVTPSEEVDWPRYSSGDSKGGTGGASSGWGGVMNLAHRPRRTRVGIPLSRNRGAGVTGQNTKSAAAARYVTPPTATTTPVSRTDTNSAASTVYNVRYHPVASPTPPVVMPQMEEEDEMEEPKEIEIDGRKLSNVTEHRLFTSDPSEQSPQIAQADPRWRTLFNSFRPRRASLPKEVASAQAGDELAEHHDESDMPLDGGEYEHEYEHKQYIIQPRSYNKFLPFHRGVSGSGSYNGDTTLPVTVIPARRRGQHTWLPQNRLLEQSASHETRPGRSDLPVRIIPSQPQASAPWSDLNLENGNGNYVLRYDPDSAALINEHVSRSHTSQSVNDDGDQASSTASTVSEEIVETMPEQVNSHHQSGSDTAPLPSNNHAQPLNGDESSL
ncbi:hypothetical protein N7495_005975 [Penicillium taxi]|uniref:uncharacterized protein n=1 Tax=Penicillium taxi TaxID=168475 RepID=UPI002545A43D|nr:uncharacterized protein N7495_005975 [Penicillium taxi]KAJ5894284.1 hypothetical protein N7495_005975 [Penicillium taxi]